VSDPVHRKAVRSRRLINQNSPAALTAFLRIFKLATLPARPGVLGAAVEPELGLDGSIRDRRSLAAPFSRGNGLQAIASAIQIDVAEYTGRNRWSDLMQPNRACHIRSKAASFLK
jgi:hypothetical protein